MTQRRMKNKMRRLLLLISLFIVQTRSKTVPTINDISKIDELLADKIEYIEKDILNLIIKSILTSY